MDIGKRVFNQMNQIIEELKEDLISIRRELHKIPEPSGREYKTQALICRYLEKFGIEHKKAADTGVYAIIRTGKKGKTMAFRGDMDGLPIKEETGAGYSSEHDGYMHACGHDAHMTFILGVAAVLNKVKDRLTGNFVFLFQPSEECNGGAERMIKEGVLDHPKVDGVIGSHVWSLPIGTIVAKKGPIMACPDGFKITIRGKGGHGATPELCRNPVIPLAQITAGLQALAADYVNYAEPVVISVCNIHAGSAYNVIPEHGFLEGTIRTYNPEVRETIIRKIKQLVADVAQTYEVEGEFILEAGYPATINDSALAEWVYEHLLKINPEDKILNTIKPLMVGEDFSYYCQAVPSVLLLIGIGNEEKGCTYPLHHPKFNIDEEVIPFAVRNLAYLAVNYGEELSCVNA